MHSGRTMGWEGQIERPPAPRPHQHGRHRKTTVTGAWTPRPRVPGADEDIPAREYRPAIDEYAADHVVIPDPLVDTDPAGGLHKFDLGMVPASVTPPRSWRRAAWFAVASSTAALGGLVFATSALVSNSTTVEGIDLPGMPRGKEYPPIPGQDPHYLTGDQAHPEPSRSAGLVESMPPSAGADVQKPATAPGRAETGVSGSAVSGHPGADSATGSAGMTAPHRPPTTERPRLLAFSDTEPIKQRSDQYFSAVRRGDLHSAYAMTTGALREEGFEAFASRYAHATSIEVVEVYVTSSSTVTTLRLTRPDGSVETQRRELRFTAGENPMISADDQVG